MLHCHLLRFSQVPAVHPERIESILITIAWWLYTQRGSNELVSARRSFDDVGAILPRWMNRDLDSTQGAHTEPSLDIAQGDY